ncbi:hypothetical protein POUND7_017119, partial [Theobroma cacao]
VDDGSFCYVDHENGGEELGVVIGEAAGKFNSWNKVPNVTWGRDEHYMELGHCACQDSDSRCFPLVSKLLPNREYSEACSILNIMNGPWLETPSCDKSPEIEHIKFSENTYQTLVSVCVALLSSAQWRMPGHHCWVSGRKSYNLLL